MVFTADLGTIIVFDGKNFAAVLLYMRPAHGMRDCGTKRRLVSCTRVILLLSKCSRGNRLSPLLSLSFFQMKIIRDKIP